MPGYHVTISSFGSLPSHVKVANNNAIRVETSSTRGISSLAGTVNFVNENATVVGVKIDRGAVLDDELKELIQTIQQQFINTYMDFSMNELKTNIQDGYLLLDPSTNVMTRNRTVSGITRNNT